MKKYIRVFFASFFLSLVFVAASVACSVCDFTASTIKEFGAQVFKYQQEHSSMHAMCFVDLDDTTIKYPGYLGSEKWFSDVLNDGVELSYMFFAALSVHQAQIKNVKLTEKTVVGVYEMIKNLKIPVVGLTSRTYILSGATSEQLEHVGIQFSNPWGSRLELNDDPLWKAIYMQNEGVVYCSGKNKGNILLTLMDSTKYAFGGNGSEKVDTIIVLDNDKRHLDKIRDAFRDKPISLILVLYAPLCIAKDCDQEQAQARMYTNFMVDYRQFEAYNQTKLKLTARLRSQSADSGLKNHNAAINAVAIERASDNKGNS